MPVMPAAASAAPLSCTPPSVAALKPAACIAAKSVEVNRTTPRVTDAPVSPRGGFGEGLGLGLADGDGVGGGGAGVGDGLAGGGGAAPVSRGRMSPAALLLEFPSRPTPYASSRPRSTP